MNRNQELRTYTELNRYVIRHSMSLAYRFWLLARKLDTNGSGRVSKKAFRTAMGMNNLTPAHLRYASDSFFIEEREGYIYYQSLNNVCVHFKTKPGRIVNIPLNSIKSKASFNSFLYASWFTQGVTISRNKIEQLFGLSEATQRRYERKAHMILDKNYGRGFGSSVPTDILPVNSEDVPQYGQKNTGHIVWQLPNTISSRLYHGPTGNTRKVTRNVNRIGVEYRDDASRKERIFFTKSHLPGNNYQLTNGFSYIETRTIPTRKGKVRFFMPSNNRPVSRSSIM